MKTIDIKYFITIGSPGSPGLPGTPGTPGK